MMCINEGGRASALVNSCISVYYNALKEIMYFSVLPSSCNVLKQRWASSMIFTTIWTTQACNPVCWNPLEVKRFSTQLLRNAILLRSFEKWIILCREISKEVPQHEISEDVYVKHLNEKKYLQIQPGTQWISCFNMQYRVIL